MCDRVTPPSHVFWDERGANGNAIPVFIVEEHREAYCVISYAIKTGLLPPHGNALVHIDEHHDLACPVLLGPADVRSQPLSDIFVCTFDYLRICDFLIPLLHQRVFEELYWVRRDGLCRRSIPLDIRVEQVENAYFFVYTHLSPERRQALGACQCCTLSHHYIPLPQRAPTSLAPTAMERPSGSRSPKMRMLRS